MQNKSSPVLKTIIIIVLHSLSLLSDTSDEGSGSKGRAEASNQKRDFQGEYWPRGPGKRGSSRDSLGVPAPSEGGSGVG